MTQKSFNDIADSWVFCCAATLRPRWERCRILATTEEQHKLVKRMFDKYLVDIALDKWLLEKEGRDVTELNLVLQHDNTRYAGPLLFDRFQIMEALVPNTYYIADHTLDDLLYRQRANGRLGEVMHFTSIEEAKNTIGQIINQGVVTEPSRAKLAPEKLKETTKVARKLPTPEQAAVAASGAHTAAAMFRVLILQNTMTDDEIFSKVKAAFNLEDSKRSYVAWYRNSMKKKGDNPPAPIGGVPRMEGSVGSPDRMAAMKAGKERKAAERAAAAEAERAAAEKEAKRMARLNKKSTKEGEAIVENARNEELVKRGKPRKAA